MKCVHFLIDFFVQDDVMFKKYKKTLLVVGIFCAFLLYILFNSNFYSFANEPSVILENGKLSFNNIASLRRQACELALGQIIQTKGYRRINDGGAGLYKIRKKNASDVDDGGAVILLDNGNVADLITSEIVNVKQFGAVGDGITDDTLAIQKTIDYLSTKRGGTVFIPIGQYKISDTLTVCNSNMKIKGHDKSLSVLRPTTDLIVDTEKYKVKCTLSVINKNKTIKTKLKGKVVTGDNWISVENSSGVFPGMLVYIQGDFSTSPWTSDNRGKAIKGETNKVSSVKGNLIYLCKAMSTTFAQEEDVCITFVQPLVGIEISDLGVSCSDNCPEDERQYRGFSLTGCDHAIITDCYGNGCGTSCFESTKSYKTVIKNNYVKNAWSYQRESTSIYGFGYGFRTIGDSLSEIINNKAEECRHCIDISGVYPSHGVLISNNSLISSVSRAGVISTHGPAEGCVFENNFAEGPVSILIRGENISVKNNILKGRVYNFFGRNNSFKNNKIFGNMMFRQEDTIEDNNFNIIKNNDFYIKSDSVIFLSGESSPFTTAHNWIIENNNVIQIKDKITNNNVFLLNVNNSKSEVVDFQKGFVFNNNTVRHYNNSKSYPLKICSDITKVIF